ncbi:zinc finger protein 599 [Anopheles gambiae]|uniref:C2H2-type domain-containing protein n=1 Tax=Anopheles coluzzii TaxID=1518534 RepID=A0A6E8W200_ANOCL|nr:zinc finger protein 599 [Anopheles gambiae]XP_040233985.2 zinc finger protein 599-like [Anopheles coluzzii]
MEKKVENESVATIPSTTSTGTVEAMKQVETQAPQQILSQTPMQENPAGTNGTKEPQRKCLMCLLPFDELSSIGTASAEELKRIVDNIYKIAKIEVKPVDGKIEPLCNGCRAKLGYDYDEDAYFDMLSQMYNSEAVSKPPTITMHNGIPVHVAVPCDASPDSPLSGPGGHYIDAACGTFVVTELGVEALNADKDELVCAICSKAFNFKSTLRLHIRSHHQTAPRDTIELPKHPRKPRTYECTECNLSFKLKYDFDKHVGTHKKPSMHQCEGCFKLFKHKSYYLMHRNLKRCKAQFSIDLTNPLDPFLMADGQEASVGLDVPLPIAPSTGRRKNGTAKERNGGGGAGSLGSVPAFPLQCTPELGTLTDCGIRNAS